ncbi:MAG TPA: ribbon-helix-helix domain-containing protein [Pseudolabrys sp.]|nr:ribbon-helix-helix domain-containing protein [Pseudolabrys sp.]
MKSGIVKRSIVINGHKTSVSLEDLFWNDLKQIAFVQETTPSKMIADIDKAREHGNLSSAIRLFVLDQVRVHGSPWQYSPARRPSKILDEVSNHRLQDAPTPG